MLITENFALLNILRAIEKLSAAANDKNAGESAAAADGETCAQNTAAADKAAIQENPDVAESLLMRHEREVFRIKNGKKR